MNRPVAYLVKQRGLSEYAEVVYTKREAVQAAQECLWWSQQVTVTPLYAGEPIQWISRPAAARRARTAESRREDQDTPASSSARRGRAAAGRPGPLPRRKTRSSS